MDIKLNCEITRDLLPSYADDLTSAGTNSAVEEHLANCADCADILARMKEPEPPEAQPAEVNYLKKAHRRFIRTGILCGAAVMLIALIILAVRFLYIGSEESPKNIFYSVSVVDSTVYVSGNLVSSTNGVSRVKFTEKDGVVDVAVYTAPKWLLNRSSFSKEYKAEGNISAVQSEDLTLWEYGSAIGRTTAKLYALKTPYIGAMSANADIAEALGIGRQLGNYTNELHTVSEPYGWTFRMKTPYAADENMRVQELMRSYSCVLMSVIGNLGYVEWEYYLENGEAFNFTVTAEGATAFAGADIKRCADSLGDLQELMQKLDLSWSGKHCWWMPEEFRINIRNNTDADICKIAVDYYLDGKLIASRAVENADGSVLKIGESVEFDFNNFDFPDGTSTVDLSKFSFDLSATDKDGNEIALVRNVAVAAKYSWEFFYTLRGDSTRNYILHEG